MAAVFRLRFIAFTSRDLCNLCGCVWSTRWWTRWAKGTAYCLAITNRSWYSLTHWTGSWWCRSCCNAALRIWSFCWGGLRLSASGIQSIAITGTSLCCIPCLGKCKDHGNDCDKLHLELSECSDFDIFQIDWYQFRCAAGFYTFTDGSRHPFHAFTFIWISSAILKLKNICTATKHFHAHRVRPYNTEYTGINTLNQNE